VKASALRYRFEVANHDGYFNEGAGGIFFYSGIFEAAPQECFVKHKISVWDPAAVAWSAIPHMDFIGKIMTVGYEDGAAPDKYSESYPQFTLPRALPKSAVITCEQHGIWNTFRRGFTRDDADISMIDDPAGAGKYYLDA